VSEEIGLIRKTFRLANDVFTLGGSARLREVNKQLEYQARVHSQLLSEITSVEAAVKNQLGEIGRWFQIAMKSLTDAERLLKPVEEANERENTVDSLAMPSLTGLKIREMNSDYESFVHVAAGAGAGVASAAGVWGAVQIAGHASTGAAMIGLHGAAASSAGWAWLGGGSLAAGGGGMALGHLVLPGIGSVVAIAVGASLSHREANKREHELEKLWDANNTNRGVLVQLKVIHADYDAGISSIRCNAQRLGAAVDRTNRKVMRFGFLSRIWKTLRRICGYSYYTSKEQFELRQLEDAIARFFESLNSKSDAHTSL
jgi:hypothetical protein